MIKNENNKNQPIKIVYLTPHLFIGGAERLLIDVVKRLDRQKFDISICCLKAGAIEAEQWRKELEAKGISVRLLSNYNQGGNFITKVFRTMVIAWRLFKYLKEVSPDILQTQLSADIYRPIGRLARVPKIISIEHNLDKDEPRRIIFLKKLFRKSADRIIAVSTAVKQDAIKRYGYKAEIIEVIYNGVDYGKFYNIRFDWRKVESPNYLWRFGAVGRLVPQKGFDLLLTELAQLPQAINWQCSIAGVGRQEEGLKQLAEYLKITDKISFLGHVTDVPKFLSSLDVFIVPSRWEGLGLVVLEAGAAGLPVFASRVDGIKEIINDKKDGYLFKAEQKGQLAKYLNKSLSGDLRQLTNCAENLQKKVKQEFSIDQTVLQYENFYKQLIQVDENTSSQ